jgi:hypothetical protein
MAKKRAFSLEEAPCESTGFFMNEFKRDIKQATTRSLRVHL